MKSGTTKNLEMSKYIFRKEVINIFLIYQGEEFEKVKSEVLDKINTPPKVCDCDLHLLSRMGDPEPEDIDKSIEVNLKRMIDNCDYAFIVVMNDDRFSIEAGNLWYELGRFIGKKGWNRVKIFVDSKLEKTYITDIASNTIYNNNFESTKDLIDGIYKSILVIESELKQSNNENGLTKKKKIQLTYKTLLSNKKEVWCDINSYKCIKSNEICKTREDYLSYSSELIGISYEKEINNQLLLLAHTINSTIPLIIKIAKKEEIGSEVLNSYISTLKTSINNFGKNIQESLIEAGYIKTITIDNISCRLQDFVFARYLNRDKFQENDDKKTFEKYFEEIFDLYTNNRKLITFSDKNDYCNNLHNLHINNLKILECITHNVESLKSKHTINLFVDAVKSHTTDPETIHDKISSTEVELPYYKREYQYYNFWNDKVNNNLLNDESN
jgi:hypothetical protein